LIDEDLLDKVVKFPRVLLLCAEIFLIPLFLEFLHFFLDFGEGLELFIDEEEELVQVLLT